MEDSAIFLGSINSQDSLYHINLSHQPSQFYLKVRNSKTREHVSSELWRHSCSLNDHVISKYKSQALDCIFHARYLLQHIKKGVTSRIQLQKILIMQCFSINHRTCFGNCYFEIAIQLRTGIQLYSVLFWLNESEWKIRPFRYNWSESRWGCCFKWRFSIQTFIRSFNSLQAQKWVAPYTKFTCLDALHLSGKFKGMCQFLLQIKIMEWYLFLPMLWLVGIWRKLIILPQTLSKFWIRKFN